MEGRGSAVYTPVSPSRFLAVEASAVLSSLQTIPEFAETLELIDSVSWVILMKALLTMEVAKFVRKTMIHLQQSTIILKTMLPSLWHCVSF